MSITDNIACVRVDFRPENLIFLFVILRVISKRPATRKPKRKKNKKKNRQTNKKNGDSNLVIQATNLNVKTEHKTAK